MEIIIGSIILGTVLYLRYKIQRIEKYLDFLKEILNGKFDQVNIRLEVLEYDEDDENS